MCNPFKPASMRSPRETADAGSAAFNVHDLTALAALYRPDVLLVTPDAGELKGREEAAEYQRAFMHGFLDGHAEVVAKYDAGNTTIDEWVFRGTNSGHLQTATGETIAPTGRRVEVRGIDVQTHVDGGIAMHHVYFDQLEFLTQLGLMPEA